MIAHFTFFILFLSVRLLILRYKWNLYRRQVSSINKVKNLLIIYRENFDKKNYTEETSEIKTNSVQNIYFWETIEYYITNITDNHYSRTPKNKLLNPEIKTNWINTLLTVCKQQQHNLYFTSHIAFNSAAVFMNSSSVRM